jgi:hypothetical protein
MRYSRLIIWASLSVLLVIPLIASNTPSAAVSAQYDTCTELVETALTTTDEVCNGTNRNQACYGHDMLSAEAQPGVVENFDFSAAGDRVNVGYLNSLRLSPMNLDEGTWGVALLELQADIPDDKPQNVSLLLFGDVQVENLVPEPVLMDVTVRASGNANVRKEPEDTAFVMATLPRQTTVTASGRSEDNEWIYVNLPGEDDTHGWVSRTLLTLSGDMNSLNVIDPYFTQYGPMQAFYLETGQDQTMCAEAPSDGLLVQTPEGVAEIRLWINEVKIRLGSTAFIQAQSGSSMTINTLEGTAHVEALGVEQVAMAGTGVTVQLNADSGAAAPPSKAKPYQAQDVENLPTENLDRPIVPVLTATSEVVAEVTQQVNQSVVNTPETVLSTSEVTVEPISTSTFTPIPPTDTNVPPTDTVAPPTDTVAPPATQTDEPTSVPLPTSEPLVPTDPGVSDGGQGSSSQLTDQPTDPPPSPAETPS